MAPDEPEARLCFQDALELVPLPSTGDAKRFMSTRAAWLPGSDLPPDALNIGRAKLGRAKLTRTRPLAAFGGHAYCQSALAICLAVEEEEERRGVTAKEKKLVLHTIHGYFTAPGWSDRPFVYSVSFISRGRSFVTARVDARQPLSPTARRDHFQVLDAAQPLGDVCFTAIVSLMLPRPHSRGVSTQEQPVQKRFASILQSRPLAAWDPAPPLDIDPLVAAVGRNLIGTFPLVDMKKVDMATYNAARPVHEHCELILYRLLAPLPLDWQGGANAHVLAHAYEADRNGLLMLSNHLGFGNAERVASLSYSFVVHTNADDAVMKYGSENDAEAWWVQEVSFPRAATGRGVVMSKIWSPSGVHVATEYQDGLCIAQEGVKGTLKL